MKHFLKQWFTVIYNDVHTVRFWWFTYGNLSTLEWKTRSTLHSIKSDFSSFVPRKKPVPPPPPKIKWIFRSWFRFGNNMMLVITRISKTFSDTLNYVRLGTQILFKWYSLRKSCICWNVLERLIKLKKHKIRLVR